jgi:hypothetical protein
LDRASCAQEQCGGHDKASDESEELIAGGEDFEAVHFGSPSRGLFFAAQGDVRYAKGNASAVPVLINGGIQSFLGYERHTRVIFMLLNNSILR